MGGADGTTVEENRPNRFHASGSLHEYFLSENYEEVEAFYGSGIVHLGGATNNLEQLVNTLISLEIKREGRNGVIVLPSNHVPESQAFKEKAKYAVYLLKQD